MVNRYKVYEGAVTPTTPITYDVYSDLGKQIKSGYIVCDTGVLKVNLDNDGELITIKKGEILDLTGAEIAIVQLSTTETSTDYRVFVSIWDIN